MNEGYSTVELKSWQEFKNYVTRFSQNWAYRGQASASWILNNAIERTDFIQFRKGIEFEFLSEFQRGVRNYLAKDETPEHLIEWLALMQHHGAPTRLLDLTKSPFIAAYFAFEQCGTSDGENVAVWALNIQQLKLKAVEIFSDTFGDALEETHNLINESLYEKIFYENNRKLVFPVEPFRMNRRYSLQQSIFVSTGTSQHPFMEQLEFLGDDLKKSVVKIEIPVVNRKQAMRELQQMNLHRASLFPDIDGYAMSLRLRYDNMLTPTEVIEQNVQKIQDEGYHFFP